jgi:hypothetical protein
MQSKSRIIDRNPLLLCGEPITGEMCVRIGEENEREAIPYDRLGWVYRDCRRAAHRRYSRGRAELEDGGG